MDDDHVIILFDGVCELCNWIVRFSRKRMKPGRLRFAPLQSPEGRQLQQQYGFVPEQSQSVIAIADDRAYAHSAAAIRLLRELRFPWPMFAAIGRILPRPLRDVIYNWIARKRFDWFGRTDACPLPDRHITDR